MNRNSKSRSGESLFHLFGSFVFGTSACSGQAWEEEHVHCQVQRKRKVTDVASPPCDRRKSSDEAERSLMMCLLALFDFMFPP